MFRRPVAARRGPGVIGTVARTAVVAGTATATAHAVGGAMDNAAQRKQEAAAADQAAFQSQAQIEQMQAQMNALQAQQAQAAAAPAPAAPSQSDDFMAKLQQLAQLKDSGVLTDEEFAAAKAKLLGS